MAPQPSNTRAAQLTTSGLGAQFVSPRKPRNKLKTQTLVELPGQKAKQDKLQAKLAALLAGKPTSSSEPTTTSTSPDIENTPADAYEDSFIENEVFPLIQPDESVPPLNTSECIKSHRILPDVAAARLYDTWKTLIPTLVDVQLGYTQRTVGKILERPSTVLSACRSQKCAQRRTTLIGLFFDSFTSLDVLSCRCATAAQVLILHGLFPTSPSQPRMAVSTDLLAFYRALFERSCDAVNALASALHTHYVRRGFRMTNGKVSESMLSSFDSYKT
ncbi:uncharacterized protein F5891DRAFT_987159 [Suillus fuscotomentosus]|uniref:CxC1-like cysteine cluster associated with KDZ transposases domain-containing protein n=1 Tax=Suillus fuscotomentosus TaxID=1912939 RepID=A0AAD4DQI8_9AGAM|nr:uncharacterized protein F5891DRAFT_987159 [Suillus fuscotomentosus]KAG1889816.1 hypothetical protein F5891DRAFT_987159 [Suillus fuscotomentosus]